METYKEQKYIASTPVNGFSDHDYFINYAILILLLLIPTIYKSEKGNIQLAL